MQLKTGQIWKENDSRFLSRTVKILAIDEAAGKVQIQRVGSSNANPYSAFPKRWTKISRFGAKKGGYRLSKEGE